MDHEKVKFINFCRELKKEIEAEVQKIAKEPFFDELSRFITDYYKNGGKYFYKLRPLFDKYGYHLIIGEIYRICADEITKKQKEDKE